MALEVKLGQDLRLRQQLVMTPQLQQAIKILQLSLPKLETVVQTELEQNPMLEPLDQSPAEAAREAEAPDGDGVVAAAEEERLGAGPEATPPDEPVDDWEPGDGAPEAPLKTLETEAHDAAVELKQLDGLDKLDWHDYLETYSNNWQESAPTDSEDDHRSALENTSIRRRTLEDYLMWQLGLTSLSDADRTIAATIIYNLNDDGYLETPLEELAQQLESTAGEVERVLKRVQRFDPPGCAARDLRECLLLQLENLGMEGSLAARIVRERLDLLEKHRYSEIARQFGVSVE